MVKKVLISGASIAGPTAALVLARHGIDTTVVEKAGALRGGGYPIDIRAVALEVVRRLGILERLRQYDIEMKNVTFVNSKGKEVGPFDITTLTGSVPGVDIELPRGELSAALYEATRDIVSYRFNDSIKAIQQNDSGVDVRFESGHRDHYDIVIGADGLHSNVRSLVFGSEYEFERYIGFCFAGFSFPNPRQIAHECQIYNSPGRFASVYAVRENAPLIGMLTFRYPESPFKTAIDATKQRDLTAKMFGGSGWIVPELVDHMRKAGDLYFDAVSQIRMPKWSSGRVVLTGDAAHATSFLSGQGSSVSLVSAYILGNEIAAHADHSDAFEAYQLIVRDFAQINQDLVDDGWQTMMPPTEAAIEARNAAVAAAAQGTAAKKQEVHGERARPAYSAISLPEYK
jgi:2-polyprenyl-6-methoxyphenol hydroxylase-like FAD-dependent oxidoreductase